MAMAVILLVVTGAALGWLVSVVRQVDDPYEIATNLAVGMVGALVGGMVLCPMIGGANPLLGMYGMATLVLSFGTACGAPAVFHIASTRAIR